MPFPILSHCCCCFRSCSSQSCFHSSSLSCHSQSHPSPTTFTPASVPFPWKLLPICHCFSPNINFCVCIYLTGDYLIGWLHGTVVERRSLTDELSLSHARPVADGWPPTYVGKPSAIGQLTRPTQPFIFSGSINWVVTNFIRCVLVALSGECSRGWVGAFINRYTPCVAALWLA